MPKSYLSPGIHSQTLEEYLLDRCPNPSLTSSTCRILLTRSPRHAWLAHPRLNLGFEPERREPFDLGQAAHALMLGDERDFEIIDAADWRKKEHKERRNAAYMLGKIPLLAHQFEQVETMVLVGRSQLRAHRDAAGAFIVGKPEQTLIWEQAWSVKQKLWLRCRLDWLPEGDAVFYEYKTTAASAHPGAWRRNLFDQGLDVQAAFYLRGIAAVLDLADARFRFVVQEREPPYALSVLELTPAALDMARRKVDEAIRIWAWCLEHDRWPGYPARVAHIDPPGWHEQRWLEHEDKLQGMVEAGDDEQLTIMGAG